MFRRPTLSAGFDHGVLMCAGQAREIPEDWYRAGLPMQRLWMELREEGLELLPLSQGLQEYQAVASYYRQLHDLWAEDGETVQMILLVGRPRGRFRRSPRLPVDQILSVGAP